MRKILVCINTKLTKKMSNSAIKIVNKCHYKQVVDRCRLLGLSYDSIPIKPTNMNRVAVLLGQVRSIK